MKNPVLLLLAAALPLSGAPRVAAAAETATPVAATAAAEHAVAQIKTVLGERFPDIVVTMVRPAPWPGLYEVFTGTELVYTNADASLLFAGRILDTKSREDLTARRLGEINSIDFGSLPLDVALKQVKGAGTRKLVVFADPDCPYCKQLEQTLAAVDDVTVYTFVVPFESIHPGAIERAKLILCAPDPARAWQDWMHNSQLPAAGKCDAARYNEMQAQADRVRVASTPTLFFESGFRIPGAVGAAELERQFAAAAAARAAAGTR